MLGNHTTQVLMSTNTPTSLTLTTQYNQSSMLGTPHLNPTPYTPPHDHPYADPTPYDAILTALCRYLPSNAVDDVLDTDEFRMYEFKVRGCTRPKAHDWTECPFAHPGEKARRRDPRRYSYSGTACTDFRKGGCRRGDSCDFAHGVFECWLHPTRYRTQACKDGPSCARRVCFFAHSPAQLRVGSGSGSPDPFEESPPCHSSVSELAKTLRSMQLSKVKSMGSGSPRFRGAAAVRTGFYSLPVTPTGAVGRTGYLDGWEEDPVMERPIWESRLDMQGPVDANTGGSAPDIGWVSELIK